jgi:hypothetical protein
MSIEQNKARSMSKATKTELKAYGKRDKAVAGTDMLRQFDFLAARRADRTRRRSAASVILIIC